MKWKLIVEEMNKSNIKVGQFVKAKCNLSKRGIVFYEKREILKVSDVKQDSISGEYKFKSDEEDIWWACSYVEPVDSEMQEALMFVEQGGECGIDSGKKTPIHLDNKKAMDKLKSGRWKVGGGGVNGCCLYWITDKGKKKMLIFRKMSVGNMY